MGFGDWNRPGPVPNGLVETVAAGLYARYGYFPEGYVEWAKRYGGVPRRVFELAELMAFERRWELPKDPHPGMTRIRVGGLSFLVSTAELMS